MSWKPLGRTSWYPSVLATSAADRRSMGIFSVAGRERSAGRNQFPVAAVRNRESVAGDGGSVRRDDDHHQDASREIHASHARAIDLASDSDVHRIMAQNIRSRPTDWISVAGAETCALSGGSARLIFNNRLDAIVTAALIVMVALVLVESLRQWLGILSGKKQSETKETPFVLTRLAEEQA